MKTLLLAVIFFGVAADAALAWGPATHVGLGETLLSQLSLLPAGLAALLSRHAVAYLYGNIAADLVFAKRMSRIKQSCHHWSTGLRLLDEARHDRTRAFAYGYLSHLAADTVAHGKYVPRQIMMSGCSQNFGHFYWEIRAESAQPDSVWKRFTVIADLDHGAHHLLLRRHITHTFLSYPVNRLLFDGMNALTVRRSFRRSVYALGRVSRWPLSTSLLAAYHGDCVDRILSVLLEGRRSPVLRDDPNGTSALMQVRIARNEVRRMSRRGLPVRPRLIEASRSLAPSERRGAAGLDGVFATAESES